ncbi:metalloregulator ArsR/SmtB family transcription factor [Chitinophagales bacterium]|jgi:DNA-binding transcriptional ArsR family regulator|nr:metalloregulator ArsR/SmtB family transcription factor [Chitinophagales bacterium]|tara:strand:- start:342 stop:683 length:342 start_codon:yes stop_codon:yes gene_type:complete
MGFSTKKIADIAIKDGNKDIIIKGGILQNAALAVRAINHPLRKKVIDLLEKNGEMVVTDIYVHLRTEQSVASQHLAILRNAGFVDTRRDGKFIHYTLNKGRFKNSAELIEKLA